MKYVPRDASQDPPRGSDRLLAPGQYNGVVKKATEKESSNHNEMIELIITFYPNDGGSPVDVFDYLVAIDSAAWKTRNFCAAAGLNYASGEISAAECEGLNVITSVKPKKGKRKDDGSFYPDRNTVEDYVEAGASHPGLPVEDEDGLPF